MAWQLAFTKKINYSTDSRCCGDLNSRKRLCVGRGALCKYFAPEAKLKVPQLLAPEVVLVIVPLFDTSVAVDVTTNVEGTVKLQAFVPLPTMIFDPAPDTVQDAPIVGVALLRMLKVLPGVVKSGGLLPLPSVLVPQLVKTSKLPVDFE